ncbi:hypothetical protein MRX96_014105 [Rhipicephalus microplus]
MGPGAPRTGRRGGNQRRDRSGFRETPQPLRKRSLALRSPGALPALGGWSRFRRRCCFASRYRTVGGGRACSRSLSSWPWSG